MANAGSSGHYRMTSPGYSVFRTNSLGVATGQMSQGFSVRLATVVSESAGGWSSVPACCGYS